MIVYVLRRAEVGMPACFLHGVYRTLDGAMRGAAEVAAEYMHYINHDKTTPMNWIGTGERVFAITDGGTYHIEPLWLGE